MPMHYLQIKEKKKKEQVKKTCFILLGGKLSKSVVYIDHLTQCTVRW